LLGRRQPRHIRTSNTTARHAVQKITIFIANVTSFPISDATWRLISGENSVDADVRGQLSTNNVSITLRFVEQRSISSPPRMVV
jgi:hypothetical protein